MWKALFESNGLLDLPVAVMVFFIAIFAAVMVRTLSRSRSTHYRDMSRMPLGGNDQ